MLYPFQNNDDSLCEQWPVLQLPREDLFFLNPPLSIFQTMNMEY